MPDSIAERQNLSTVKRTEGVGGGVATWQAACMTFGTRLREARKARGLTGVDLGERAGLSESAISRWESGKRAPQGVMVSRLARALGVTEKWLLSGDGPKEPSAGGSVPPEYPVGAAALHEVLVAYAWPEEVPPEIVDEIEALLRVEAKTSAGSERSASAWRHRIGFMLRERNGRPKSRPRLTTVRSR